MSFTTDDVFRNTSGFSSLKLSSKVSPEVGYHDHHIDAPMLLVTVESISAA